MNFCHFISYIGDLYSDENLDRMEYISDGENWIDPDYLPVGLSGHCLIRITDKTLLLTGGDNNTNDA